MKTAAIIPTRGDRKELLLHCMKQLANQTVKPDKVYIIDYPPKSNDFDLVPRIRRGYELAKDADLVFIIEDDDYYPDTYFEDVLSKFKSVTPDIIGIQKTTYYHIKEKKYRQHDHPFRSSLFTTVLKGGLNIDWPKDNEPFLDLHLWRNNKFSKGYYEPKEMPIGIKHGIGKTGGNGHNGQYYRIHDKGMKWLEKRVRKESFEFYKRLK